MTDKKGSIEIEVVSPDDAAAVTGNQSGSTEFIAEKKKVNPALIASIVSGIVVVVVIVVIIAFSGIGKADSHDFGAEAMKNLKVDTSNSDAPVFDLSSLSALNDVTESSGAVLVKGDGDVVKTGDKAILNYGMYLYSDLDGFESKEGPTPSGGEKKWAELDSTWDGKQQPFTLEVVETSDAAGSSFEQAASGGASAEGAKKLNQDLSKLANGEKVGTIFAYLMPPQGQQNPYVSVVLFKITAVNEEPALNLPEVSYEAPSNAPVISFEGEKPTITIPAGFTGTPGVTVKVLEEGDGDVVQEHDQVSVRYSGWLLDGTEFDSSFKNGTDPVTFSIAGVVKGFGAGIAGSKIGSKLEILIPAASGYGSQANGPIPADSFLIFYVDIVDAGPAGSVSAQQ